MKITYIHHSSFLVELPGFYILFDYTEGTIPELKEDKPLFVLASHRHGDHYSSVIFDLKKEHINTRYLLSYDIPKKEVPQELLSCTDFVMYGEEYHYEAFMVKTYKSTDEGVAFLLLAEGHWIYHAGDLNNWAWEGESDSWNASMAKNYREQISLMKDIAVEAAFLPLDPRQEKHFHLGFDEYMKKVDVLHAFPMHCWGDFSVIDKLKSMDCSAEYRDKIMEIRKDGQSFEL